jgi:hypothetical protein
MEGVQKIAFAAKAAEPFMLGSLIRRYRFKHQDTQGSAWVKTILTDDRREMTRSRGSQRSILTLKKANPFYRIMTACVLLPL